MGTDLFSLSTGIITIHSIHDSLVQNISITIAVIRVTRQVTIPGLKEIGPIKNFDLFSHGIEEMLEKHVISNS